jgi:FKBP-type peptidyl-prolyl cis-trans isomerase SlyD
MIVEDGVVVTVGFELRDAQGEVIQEHGGAPIVYFHGGEGEVFPKIQEALLGKTIGDEVFLQLEPEDAFGAFDPELMRIEELENFGGELSVGMEVEEVPVVDEDEPDVLADESNTGFGRVWTVMDIAEGKVVLDGNHPFAGMALRYHLIVQEVRPATEDEKVNGAAAQSLFTIADSPDLSQLH